VKVPSSFALETKPNEDGLSVNIAALATPEQTVGNAEEFGVAELSAATPLNLGFDCIHNIQPDNAAHALILGDTKPIAKKLANAITQVFRFWVANVSVCFHL